MPRRRASKKVADAWGIQGESGGIVMARAYRENLGHVNKGERIVPLIEAPWARRAQDQRKATKIGLGYASGVPWRREEGARWIEDAPHHERLWIGGAAGCYGWLENLGALKRLRAAITRILRKRMRKARR